MKTQINQKSPSICNCSKGFTLIEILIAMVVLAFGMLSISAMQTAAIRGNAKSHNLTERIVTASNHIEDLLNLPFDDARLNPGNHNPENDGVDNDGDGVVDELDDDGERQYTVTWTVTNATSSSKTISLILTGMMNNTPTTLTMNTIRIR